MTEVSEPAHEWSEGREVREVSIAMQYFGLSDLSWRCERTNEASDRVALLKTQLSATRNAPILQLPGMSAFSFRDRMVNRTGHWPQSDSYILKK